MTTADQTKTGTAKIGTKIEIIIAPKIAVNAEINAKTTKRNIPTNLGEKDVNEIMSEEGRNEVVL